VVHRLRQFWRLIDAPYSTNDWITWKLRSCASERPCTALPGLLRPGLSVFLPVPFFLLLFLLVCFYPLALRAVLAYGRKEKEGKEKIEGWIIWMWGFGIGRYELLLIRRTKKVVSTCWLFVIWLFLLFFSFLVCACVCALVV